jgi:hypothetical protein
MVACKSDVEHDEVERLDRNVHSDGAISMANVGIIIEIQKT